MELQQDWREKIIINKTVQSGVPCVSKDIPLHVIFSTLAKTLSVKSLCSEQSELKKEDLIAALQCAADAFQWDKEIEKVTSEDTEK